MVHNSSEEIPLAQSPLKLLGAAEEAPDVIGQLIVFFLWALCKKTL